MVETAAWREYIEKNNSSILAMFMLTEDAARDEDDLR